MIDSLWAFLTSSENREVLSWIGGGAAVVGGGLWAVLRSRGGRRDNDGDAASPAPAAAPDFLADRGGQAAGRDIYRNSNNSAVVSHGLSGWHLIAIIAILAGVGLLTVSQIGSRVSANGGSSAVGGDVNNSTISIGQ